LKPFDEIVRKLKGRVDKKGRFRFPSTDTDILVTIFKEKKPGGLNLYGIEKKLRGLQKGLHHSTATEKLQRLCEMGFAEGTREEDGSVRYRLTLLGLAQLFYSGKIKFHQLLTYIEKNQERYLDVIKLTQPNMIEQLKKQPLWFSTQLTPDLWAIYVIPDRSELREATITRLMPASELSKSSGMDVKVQLLCVQRRVTDGRKMCLRQNSECLYEPLGIMKCQILKEQLGKEFESLKKRAS
jgi:DNA-binding PadR family transcriptional regulator